MNELTHLDLFSGIGGFALAAKWAGFRTIAMCEKDERCRRFLERTWGLPVVPDIRELDGRKYRGTFLLTGGPPCQPASRAGEQRGEADDRWLWPEALRVLEEGRFPVAVFENPPGIYDVGIDGILSEMERIGYAVQTFDIPACSVDSPQLRYRVWIVGSLADTGRERGGEDESRECEKRRTIDRWTCEADPDMADSRGIDRNERGTFGHGQSQADGPRAIDARLSAWGKHVWVPCEDGKLRRAPDESLDVVNGLHRSLLSALGNAIVPQVAYQILKAIAQIENDYASSVPAASR